MVCYVQSDRTSLPQGRQWMPQLAEERYTGVHGIRIGQHLPGSPKVDGTGAPIRPEKQGRRTQKRQISEELCPIGVGTAFDLYLFTIALS